MGELIEGMLTLSRAVKADLRRVSVDLTGLAEEIVQDLRQHDPQRSADFVIQLGLRTVGDPALLRAVMTNLLGNAWKFTARRPKARIEVGRRGEEAGQAVFFVRDNGAGFEMAYAAKLFTPFQRLHHESEFPGTGIGLATVQQIVARHGGRVWAEARSGEGATFFLTLPIEAQAPPPY